MAFTLETIKDKVEFFESNDLKKLEKMIAEQIDNNKELMLSVHSVSHQVLIDPRSGIPLYSAVVHFKANG